MTALRICGCSLIALLALDFVVTAGGNSLGLAAGSAVHEGVALLDVVHIGPAVMNESQLVVGAGNECESSHCEKEDCPVETGQICGVPENTALGETTPQETKDVYLVTSENTPRECDVPGCVSQANQACGGGCEQ